MAEGRIEGYKRSLSYIWMRRFGDLSLWDALIGQLCVLLKVTWQAVARILFSSIGIVKNYIL